VIAEIKQARYSNVYGAAPAFRTTRMREATVSKYCVGTAMLTPVPMNPFKPAFRELRRIGLGNS
jgi:hypothetical protein